MDETGLGEKLLEGLRKHGVTDEEIKLIVFNEIFLAPVASKVKQVCKCEGAIVHTIETTGFLEELQTGAIPPSVNVINRVAAYLRETGQVTQTTNKVMHSVLARHCGVSRQAMTKFIGKHKDEIIF